jgi:hypothetical protein
MLPVPSLQQEEPLAGATVPIMFGLRWDRR